MRSKVLALVLMVWAALPGGPVVAEDKGIQAVIDGQMQAFRAGDAGEAFTFASPTIRAIFASPENFGAMVAQGYPMIWRPDTVRYLESRPLEGAVMQRLEVRGVDGSLGTFDYEMIETAEGWKINAVTPVEMLAPNV